MKSKTPHPESLEAIAERLITMRKALGYGNRMQAMYAEGAGILRSTYNMWEKARSRPELDQAIKLCDKYGLSLDWLYRNDQAGLSKRAADALAAYNKSERTPKEAIKPLPFAKRS